MIYPPPPHFRDYVKCLLIPESTLPSQNIPPFQSQTSIRGPPRIYPPSQNIVTPFQSQTSIRGPPRIYPPSQNIPPFQTSMRVDPPRIYPSIPEYTHLLYKATLLESTLPLFSQLCATLLWPTPPSQTIPPPPLNIYMRPSQNRHIPPE